MDTLPKDLVNLILTELELTEVTQLSTIAAEGFGGTVQDILSSAVYWKDLTSKIPSFMFPLEPEDYIPLPGSWKEFYTEVTKGRGEEFAVGKYFSVAMMQRWIGFQIDLIGPAPEFGHEEGRDEIDGEEADVLLSSVSNLLQGLIESDRVNEYEEIVRFVSTGSSSIVTLNPNKQLWNILASNGGWNILLTKIPELLSKTVELQFYLYKAIRSSDIAHYLLCRRLFGEKVKLVESALNSIIQYAPQNLGFYLRAPRFEKGLAKYAPGLIRDFNKISLDKLDIVREDIMLYLARCLNDQDFSETLKDLMTPSPWYLHKERISWIIRMMLRDPRVTRAYLIDFLNREISSIQAYKLKDTLGLPISAYLQLKDGSRETLIGKFLNDIRIPNDKASKAFFDELCKEPPYDQFIEPGHTLNDVFTPTETRDLAQLILSTTRVRSLINYKRLEALYNRVF